MLFFIAFLLLVSINETFAQTDKQMFNVGSQTLVKGKVKDFFSGEPIETTIEFRTDDGKKIKTESNSITGNWEMLLSAGEYVVILQNWNVARQIEYLIVIDEGKYNEIEKDFTVRRMLPDDVVFSWQAFENKSNTLSRKASEEIKFLKEIMKFNRGVEFAFYINASDANNDRKLIQERIKTIEEFLHDWGTLKRRIIIEADLNNDKSLYPNSFSVVVKDNKDIFNNR